MTEDQPEQRDIQAEQPVQPDQRIVSREIEDEMKESYLSYSMSVIVGRALPDVRDGLKPVHRRILYAMHEMGLLSNKPFKKSATVVGNVLGKYHPHGDMAVYDSMVRMAQDFSLRYPLIKGQGNFGSIDGDSAAAYRYTESKLNKLAEEMLQDIEKNTVAFTPNFDESIQEPLVLPSKLPNLLINGSSGIAVGMATNMAPHNLREICQAIIQQIDKPTMSINEILQIVRGPDFPTGGIIEGRGGIFQAYSSGRGKVSVKAKAMIEDTKQDRKRIIINEIPYQVNKSLLIEEIARLVKDKKVQGIADIRDESDRDGLRIVIDVKAQAQADVVLNQLYSHSNLRTTFSIINLALVNNQPKTLTIKELIGHYIEHRRIVVRKRTAFDLDKAEKKAHLLEGLLIALQNLDKTITLIKASKHVEEAKQALKKQFTLSEEQSQAILEMRLQRLTSLEQTKIKDEHTELQKTIAHLKSILADEQKIFGIIKHELQELIDNYGDERKTTILDREEEAFIEEDTIEKKEVAVTITHKGYSKRIDLAAYKTQRRGGKGIIAADTGEDDFIEHVFVANSHDTLLVFTDKGQVHWLKVYQIPEATRQARGLALVNLLELDAEKITATLPIKNYDENFNVCMATKKGTIKKTPLSEFAHPRKGGVRAITLEEKDTLITVRLTDGKRNLMLGTKKGMSIKFNEQDVRPIGRTGKGVRGISLRDQDEVIGMILEETPLTILTITEHGYGKRTNQDEYRLIGRGGIGVINIQCTERNGNVVHISSVQDDDEIMIISKQGIMIRIPTKDINVIGRNTQGVRIMKLEEKDLVVSATIIPYEEGS